MPLWHVAGSTSLNPSRADNGQCYGCECIEPKLQRQSLEDKYEELRFMLDKCPLRLQPLTPPIDSTSSSRGVLDIKMKTLRTNIHGTHLWLQCMILDKVTGCDSTIRRFPQPDPKTDWYTREDIDRQILHVLHSLSDDSIQPNGYHTVCPFHPIGDLCLARFHGCLTTTRYSFARYATWLFRC